MIRFDGSEFMQSHQVARLIGAPPGYVGFDASEPGLLIREANRLRKGVVLLDEINMFHEDILKMLYQIAGEGRATGSNGTTASFKDFVIMMTMNPNAPIPENATREELIEFLIKSTNGKFTSAMLNRFDEIVLTNKLDRAVFSKILNKEISRLNASMAKDLRQLRITKEAEAAMLEPFLKGEVTSRDLNRMVRTVVGDPINRLRNSVLWRGKDGLDHELRFADGDLVELDYSAATGYVWRLVK